MQLNDGQAAESRGDSARSDTASSEATQQLWFDGELQDADKLQATLGTHALHYGSGVFEGERAYGGEIFKLDEHTRRLHDSAAILGFEIKYQRTNPGFAFLERGPDRVVFLSGSHPREALGAFDRRREVFARKLVQGGLVVEQVDVGQAAGLEEAEDPFGLGGEVRVAGERLVYGVRGLGLAGEQAGEGDAADAESGGAQEASAVQEAQVVLDRVVHRLRVSSRLRRRLAVRVHAATSGAGREASGFDSPKVISLVASAGWAT